jgi:hypothetical protein
VNDQLTNERRSIDTGRLIVGVLLVGFGLLFLFDRLFWIDLHEAFRLWPLWLMAFGVVRIAFPCQGRGGRRGSRLAGFWPLVIGGIFLLDTLDVMELHESWPLFIVGVGALMVLRAMGADGRTEARG